MVTRHFRVLKHVFRLVQGKTRNRGSERGGGLITILLTTTKTSHNQTMSNQTKCIDTMNLHVQIMTDCRENEQMYHRTKTQENVFSDGDLKTGIFNGIRHQVDTNELDSRIAQYVQICELHLELWCVNFFDKHNPICADFEYLRTERACNCCSRWQRAPFQSDG